MVAVTRSSFSRHVRRAALAILAMAGTGAILLISASPTVQTQTRPDSGDVQSAREVWEQLKAAQAADTATRVRLDSRMVRGLAILASDASGIANFDARVAHGVLSAETSISLPAGLWVNASAVATGQHSGFPGFSLKVGRVSFPSVVSRWFVGAARSWLVLNGASIPPLDEMIRQVRINQQDVLAELALPQDNGVAGGIMALSGKRLNNQLVGDIYCRLAAAQEANPTYDLSQVVRRTFGQVKTDKSEEHSRAAFVALSFLVVGDLAEAVAPEAAQIARTCPRPPGAILLHQRDDLAKHWTLSAALAAVLGDKAATSLGEWKELNDSLPSGSGFSFVDLAADRAGLQTALRALDAASAERTMGELGQATEEDLLPKVLLKAPEGLSDAQFRDRYGSVDQENYRRAVASIDQMLTKRGI